MNLSWMSDSQLEAASKGDVSQLDDHALERLANGDHLQGPQAESDPNFSGNMGKDILKNAPGALWESAKSLEPMAREGFNKISESIPEPNPTGNLPIDIARGIPSLYGKSLSETAAKVAPGFVSPLSLGLEGAGYAAKGVSQIPLFKRAVSGTGEAMAGGVQKLLGIPKENVMSVFKKPTSLFTAPTKETVSKAYNASEFPEITKSVEDITNKATAGFGATVKKGVNALHDYIDTGTESPSEILDARKALDKQIAMLDNQITVAKAGAKSALQDAMEAKVQLRQTFNRALDKMAPKLREADALASENFKVAPFRKLTLPGKINLFSPEGIARAVPGLPTAVGGTVAGAGAVAKGVGSAVENAPILGATTGAAISNASQSSWFPEKEKRLQELRKKLNK